MKLLENQFKNPHEASSRVRIFLFSLVYMCVYLCVYVCRVSWPNEKRYRPKIRPTYSHRPYLKRVFYFFVKITVTAASLEKLPCHVDFPISSQLPCFFFLIFIQIKCVWFQNLNSYSVTIEYFASKHKENFSLYIKVVQALN